MRSESVVETSSGQRKWREPTIKTLLSRLLNKGAIRAEGHCGAETDDRGDGR